MKKKYVMTAYLACAVILGIGLAIWRTVLLLRFYDPYMGEFAREASPYLSAIGYVTFGVLLLLASVFFFLKRTEFPPMEASASQITVFSSSFMGFIFFAIAVLLLIYYRDAIFEESTHIFFSTFRVIALFLMFPAAGYFLLNASAEPNGTKMKIALSFFPAIWALFYLIVSYADPSYEYSDPNRLFCNVALVTILLFLLYEARRNAVKPTLSNVQFVFGLFTIVCSAVYILPTALLTFFWEIELSTSTIFELVAIGCLIYVITLLILMIRNADQSIEHVPAAKETNKAK